MIRLSIRIMAPKWPTFFIHINLDHNRDKGIA